MFPVIQGIVETGRNRCSTVDRSVISPSSRSTKNSRDWAESLPFRYLSVSDAAPSSVFAIDAASAYVVAAGTVHQRCWSTFNAEAVGPL